MWQIATTTNRKGPWTMEDVQRYAGKFPEVEKLYNIDNAEEGWRWMLSGYNVFDQNGRYINSRRPANSCPDPQTDFLFFKALSEGLFGEKDFMDTVVLTGYAFSEEPTARDDQLKRVLAVDTIRTSYTSHFKTLQPLLKDPENIGHAELSSPFTVILPFDLSGQRRIQTILLKEYMEAIEQANANGDFEIWLMYFGRIAEK
jgi:hypothetical protein